MKSYKSIPLYYLIKKLSIVFLCLLDISDIFLRCLLLWVLELLHLALLNLLWSELLYLHLEEVGEPLVDHLVGLDHFVEEALDKVLAGLDHHVEEVGEAVDLDKGLVDLWDLVLEGPDLQVAVDLMDLEDLVDLEDLLGVLEDLLVEVWEVFSFHELDFLSNYYLCQTTGE